MPENYKASKEQIADWKTKHADVYELKAIDNNGAETYGYIGTSKMLKAQDAYYKYSGMTVSVEAGNKKEMTIGSQNRGLQAMLKILFIGGDENIISEYSKFSSIKKYLTTLLETAEGEITKL